MSMESILLALMCNLRGRGVTVRFTGPGSDDIEIGELRDGLMLLNPWSRDPLSLIFTIAHLFGHYCQFRNYDRYRHLVEAIAAPPPIDLGPDFRVEFLAYEQEAFGIGKSLIGEVRPFDAEWDTRYSLFMMADFEHFWTYVTTGRKADIRSFNALLQSMYRRGHADAAPVEALPVPTLSVSEPVRAKVTIY